MPSLKTFSYFQVTDQIVAKTVVCLQPDEELAGKTKNKKPLAKGGHLAAGPAKGGVVSRPTAPTVQGKLEVMGSAADDEDEDDDDEEVGHASGDLDMEMAALEAATKKTSTKRKSSAKMASATKKLKGGEQV